MIDTIQQAHEAVRKFVEKETGGFVQKVEGESSSQYAPTRDSLLGVEKKTPQEIYIGQFFGEPHHIKDDATFIPTTFESAYTVEVLYPPGEKTETLTVVETEHGYLISRRLMTLHRVQDYRRYWSYQDEQ